VIRLILFVLVSVVMTIQSQAAILASYDFNDNALDGTTLDLSASTTATFVTASDFTGGLGFATTTVTAFTSEGLGLDNGTGQNMGNAIANNQFFAFTLTAATGTTINLDSLVFDVGRSPNGANDFFIRSSVDMFATDIFFGNQAITQTVANQNIDLTASSFDGLSSIEFRIFFDDRQSNANGSNGTFVDNVVVNGTVVVPEPSTALLLLGFGLGLSTLFRRKRMICVA